VADIKVEGLTEAIRALNRANRDLGAEARGVLREAAITVQTAARARMGAGGGNYPHRAGMIGRSASSKGAGVSLKVGRYPWAYGAEFGAKRAWVFGRVMSAGKLRRRQFPVWRGNQFVVRGSSGPGWLIQPAIRDNLPKITQRVADGLDEIFDKAMSSAGVPRG
jgi:hypothetical protein